MPEQLREALAAARRDLRDGLGRRYLPRRLEQQLLARYHAAPPVHRIPVRQCIQPCPERVIPPAIGADAASNLTGITPRRGLTARQGGGAGATATSPSRGTVQAPCAPRDAPGRGGA